MRILFDQGTPAPLRRALTDHSVLTAYELAWTQLSNGALLRAAEAQFDVFITTEQNLPKYSRQPVGNSDTAHYELGKDTRSSGSDRGRGHEATSR
jgi:hypothetical protein